MRAPSSPPSPPVAGDFKPGSFRGAEGGYRLGQTVAGRWWWLTPNGDPAVVAGVNRVQRTATGQPVLGQLARWGFNILGSDTPAEFRGQSLPHFVELGFRQAGDCLIRRPGVCLPDVYNPSWAAACTECAASAVGPGTAACVLDSELEWGAPAAAGRPERPTLLQVCLGLDPSFAAYHAAWEFVLAPRGGELPQLAADWDVALPNKETLRQLTRDEVPLTSPGYERDRVQFAREFAQGYFRPATSRVREAVPGALILAKVTADKTSDEVRGVATGWVDALLVDRPLVGAGPVVLDDVNWRSVDVSPAANEPLGISEMERRIVRGREGLSAALAQPEVVGYFWSRQVGSDTHDAKSGGDGLFYENGIINQVVAQPLAAINAEAVAIRGGVAG